VVPLYTPAQVQVQGPEPDTEDAVPTEQRLVVGAEPIYVPLEEPQTPSTDLLAVQVGVVPPYTPAQVQVQGPEPDTEDAVPDEQKLAVGIV